MDITNDGKVHLSMGKSGNYLRTLYESDMSLHLLQGNYDFSSGGAEYMRADSSGNIYLVTFYEPSNTLVHALQKISPDGQFLGEVTVLTPPVVNNFIADQV